MESLRILLLLLWKNFMIRKRHWKMATFLQVPAPIVLFYLAQFLSTNLTNETGPTDLLSDVYYPIDSIEDRVHYNGFSKLHYAPQNNFTDLIMSATRRCLLKNTECIGYSSEKELENNASRKNLDNYEEFNAVIFNDDFDLSTKHFQYKLRSNYGFPKTLYYDFTSFRHDMLNFVPIQYCLDQSFISTTSHIPLLTKIRPSIQRMPTSVKEFIKEVKGIMFIVFKIIIIMAFVAPLCIESTFPINEKFSGVNVLMLMNGVSTFLNLLSWLIAGLIFSLLYIIPMVIILAKVASSAAVYPFLHFGDGFLAWLMLMFHMGHIISFTMHFGAYCSRSAFGIIIVLLIYVGTSALHFYAPPSVVGLLPYLGILCPNLLILQTFQEISKKESLHVGIHWSNLFETSDSSYSVEGTSGMIIILTILGICVNLTLAVYVYALMPGKYGVRKNFFYFLKSFSNNSYNLESELEKLNYDEDSGLFETISTAVHKPGISIRNLKKIYKTGVLNQTSKHALGGVSVNFYKGEITALLGHNGAGKTTMMSILSGMTSPTSGTVLINGKNIQVMDVRDLSLCPQEDMLFPSMSVSEHIYFFGMLKSRNKTKPEVRNSASALMQRLQLQDKCDALPATLSGGQKRRMCLAMAVVGDSSILILDEPTSGLDPQSRRGVWDIILGMRGDRTILISTHDMEEADILSDRIAVMNLGFLHSFGSPMYLKRSMGQGNVEITFSTEPWCNEQLICDMINPECQIARVDPGKMVQTVPFSNELPDILDTLESQKKELGITGMSISLMTLEEVFLRLTNKNMDNIHVEQSSTETWEKVQGSQLKKQFIFALLQKKLTYTLRNKAGLLFPIFFGFLYILCTAMINRPPSLLAPITPIKLNMYPNPQTMYFSKVNESIGMKYQHVCEEFGANVINPTEAVNINKAILELSKNGKDKKTMIAALEVNKTKDALLLNGLYQMQATQSVLISLNLMTNTLLKQFTGDDYSISVSTQEFPRPQDEISFYSTLSYYNIALIILLFPIATFFMIHPLREGATKAKQLQRICGVSEFSYWLAIFVIDFFIFLIIIAIILIGLISMDRISGLQVYHKTEIGITALILILFAINSLLFTYLFSFLNKRVGIVVTITNLAWIGIVTIHWVLYIVVQAVNRDLTLLHKIENFVFLSMPYISTMHSIIQFQQISTKNAMCRKLSIDFPESGCFNGGTFNCCAQNCINGICTSPLDYFYDTKVTSLRNCIIYLVIMPIIFIGMIAFLECYERISLFFKKNLKAGQHFETSSDEQVRKEKSEVARAINNLRSHQEIHLQNGQSTLAEDRMENGGNYIYSPDEYEYLVHELSKTYGHISAVKGISFGVKQRECFGLLGVNGAGKSTSFRMLTGEETPDSGIMYLGDINIETNRNEYLSRMGYCPQNDAIINSLNAREHLRFFALLRGIPRKNVEAEVEKWINKLNLKLCASQPSGQYSGGNKRRLNIAIALIGNPNLMLLDEPTTGVDPAARRLLWNVIQSCQASGQALILTSHSMEECEVLCNRLAIMVDGQLVCIGSSQELKQRFGVGFDIQIKLSPELTAIEMDIIKKDVESAFPCKLIDENMGYLMYHINNEGMKWRYMYSVMDGIRTKYRAISDFCIVSSTLEQLFLMFARNPTQIDR